MSGQSNAGVSYRAACADAANPVIAALSSNDRVAIEGYANSEYWAGWNAAIAHAATVAEGRHQCWQESSVGSSQPCDDISACADIAHAIRHATYGKPPVSRPLAGQS